MLAHRGYTPIVAAVGRMGARFGWRGIRPPGLRVLAAATVPMGAIVVAAVAASLIGTTRTLRVSVDELVADARRDRDVAQVEALLLRYHRLGNAYMVQRDPIVGAARDEAIATLDEHLSAARGRSTSTAEQRELDVLDRAVHTYVERRRALEASGASLRATAAATRPTLDRALDTIDRVQARYEDELARSERRAEQLASNAAIGGSTVLAVVLLALLAFTLGLTRWVVRPLAAVLRAIDGFRATGRPAHIPERGTEEIRRVTRALNDMTLALADQRKRQLAFVGGVAHDLRNPLSGLRMATVLARETAPDLLESEPGARLVDGVERHTERLSRMIDDILDALRIEAGELSLAMREHDLRESVRSVVEVCAHMSGRHEIELHAPSRPVLIVADALRIEQVVGNMLSNAIKYSPQGGAIDVVIRADEVHAFITVRDRGVGIAPEDLPHIFEPFRRAAPIGAPGAGLGLSVLQRIVSAHGGRVEVESQRGVGSEFRVVLPLRPTQQDAPAAQPGPTGPPRS